MHNPPSVGWAAKSKEETLSSLDINCCELVNPAACDVGEPLRHCACARARASLHATHGVRLTGLDCGKDCRHVCNTPSKSRCRTRMGRDGRAVR